MRLLYRLLPPPSTGQEQRHGRRARPPSDAAVDVVVDLSPGATVGQVADHLASHWAPDHPSPGTGWTVASAAGATVGRDAGAGDRPAPVPSRDAPAASALPRSGTTVRLVAAEHGTGLPPPASPVVVVGPAGERRLPYGRTTVANDGCEVAIEVGRAVRLLAVDAGTVTVDGVPLRGAATVAPGAVVELGRAAHVIRVDGGLRPPPPAGPFATVLPVRTIGGAVEPAVVELPTAPPTTRPPALPLVSAAVPLLMGAALWAVTHSVATVGFVLFSFAFVVAAGVESRRESRAERRFREREFARDLDNAARRLEQLRDAELARRRTASPSPEELAVAAAAARPPWHRRAGEDGASVVRVGTARLDPADRVVLHDGGRRDLQERLRAVARGHVLHDAPVAVDLARAGGLAVVGRGEPATAVARAVVVQLASLLAPGRWSVELRCAPSRREAWRWLAWLPQYGQGGGARLVVVDADDPPDPPPSPSDGDGTWWLWVGARRGGLPRQLEALLELDPPATAHAAGGCDAILHRDGAAPVACRTEGLTEDEAVAAARGLCGLRPGPTAADPTGPDGGDAGWEPLTLEDLVPGAATTGSVLQRWDLARPGLAVPLGTAAGGTLWLDLERDGPHGLVAGTTGAGKSKALRTLVAGLALHHGPDRVNLLLVDFKGGAAFGPLVDLPHTVGVVTDLRPSLARRALTSLRAEVLRREAVLHDHGTADLPALRRLAPAACPPSLVVVVDEFATLARELPDVLEGLVDLSRRGRSLGIHLVLATQRPAGVVSAEIRANTSFRLALRVADAEDSLDVVDVPDAAHLPRSRPGAALLRLGPGNPVRLQVAWTGAAVVASRPVRSRPVEHLLLAGAGGQPPTAAPTAADAGDEGSQADAVVAAVRAAQDRRGGCDAPAPWAPPLPDHLALADVPADRAPSPGRVAAGLVDLPERQRQEPWTVDLPADGGLLVLGSPGSGTARTLATVARGLVRRDTGARVVGVDGGAGGLAVDDLGPVVPAEDPEAVLRLLRGLGDEVRRRAAGTADASTRWLALVHDVGRLESAHDRVNRGEAVDLLCRLAADGPVVGVHLAVSARHRAEVPPLLLPRLGHRVALRMGSGDEAAVLGAPAELADRDLPAGRGVVLAGPEAGAWVQAADATGGPSSRPGDAPRPGPAARVPRLPDVVRLADLPARPTEGGVLPVGLDGGSWHLGLDTLPVAELDLRVGHALVVGPGRSGRSTALDLVATAAATALGPGGTDRWRRRVLVGPTPRTGTGAPWTSVLALDDLAASDDPAAVAAALEALVPPGGGPALVAVDDLTEALDSPAGHAVESWLAGLLARARREPVRLVVAADADAVSHTFSEPLRRLRAGRRGLLLRPDPDLHPPLLHCVLPPHDELWPAPGRGWLVDDDGPRPVQLALPT